jgi:hypothetical protein
MHKQILKQISSILHAWDPIGCTPPADEYDDLAIKLFSRINKGESKDKLLKYLDNYLREIIGLRNIPLQDFEKNISIILALARNTPEK